VFTRLAVFDLTYISRDQEIRSHSEVHLRSSYLSLNYPS
jgi:hypothetical protein